jgi:hypothetical protein
LAGDFALINRPDDVIFLLAYMEHDDGNSESARVTARIAAVASFGGSLRAPQATIVENLRPDIDSALPTPTGFPNLDNQVGDDEPHYSLELSR